MKASIFLVTFVIAILAIVLINFKSPATLSQEVANTRNITLKIDGMTCSMCPLTIKTALKRVDGIVGVDVSYSEQEARVEYEDSKVTVADIVKTIENAGNYKATPIHDSKANK